MKLTKRKLQRLILEEGRKIIEHRQDVWDRDVDTSQLPYEFGEEEMDEFGEGLLNPNDLDYFGKDEPFYDPNDPNLDQVPKQSRVMQSYLEDDPERAAAMHIEPGGKIGRRKTKRGRYMSERKRKSGG